MIPVFCGGQRPVSHPTLRHLHFLNGLYQSSVSCCGLSSPDEHHHLSLPGRLVPERPLASQSISSNQRVTISVSLSGFLPQHREIYSNIHTTHRLHQGHCGFLFLQIYHGDKFTTMSNLVSITQQSPQTTARACLRLLGHMATYMFLTLLARLYSVFKSGWELFTPSTETMCPSRFLYLRRSSSLWIGERTLKGVHWSSVYKASSQDYHNRFLLPHRYGGCTLPKLHNSGQMGPLEQSVTHANSSYHTSRTSQSE